MFYGYKLCKNGFYLRFKGKEVIYLRYEDYRVIIFLENDDCLFVIFVLLVFLVY